MPGRVIFMSGKLTCELSLLVCAKEMKTSSKKISVKESRLIIFLIDECKIMIRAQQI